jgi:hypothetical protein
MDPASNSTLRLTTGKAGLDIVQHPNTEAVLNKALDCLRPVFRPRPEGLADLVVEVRSFAEFGSLLERHADRPFALRRSSARPFNLSLMIGEDGDGRTIGVDRMTHTAYVAGQASCVLTIYVSNASHFHLLETLRYTALAVEQNKGTIILHASAVLAEAGAVLVLGEKGRGKTSTLLKLVLEHGLQYFSGDKVLADINEGRLRLRAWPDYPHIGLGVLRLFPSFAKACGEYREDVQGAPLPAEEKVLIHPDVFIRALGGGAAILESMRCAAVIFPDVGATVSKVRAVEGESARKDLISSATEDARIFTPGQWHGLIETKAPRPACDVLPLFDGAGWYEAKGKEADLSQCLRSAL